jgi:hypothetical protein
MQKFQSGELFEDDRWYNIRSMKKVTSDSTA